MEPVNTSTSGHRKPDKDTTENFASNKSIDEKYEQFQKQSMFSRYFLTCLGCDVNNIEQINMKHELLESYDRRGNIFYKDLYSDDFYRKYSQFSGLNGNSSVICKNTKEANLLMSNVVLGVIRLLETKMVISQDLLILCFEYCKMVSNENKNNSSYSYNSNSGSKNDLLTQFIDTLNNVTKECLASNAQTTTEIDKLTKQRSYAWFKEYLLNSNIWLAKYETSTGGGDVEVKTDDSENKDENGNRKLGILYDTVLDTVNKQLELQKAYIWSAFERVQKEEAQDYEKVLDFDNKAARVTFNRELRQDRINDGIKSLNSEDEVLLIAATMDENNDEKDNFDVVFETNTKIYLTQCLKFAHANNAR